ncbi:hypothetical protein FHW88_005171 [Mucilaginibacter sp. SG538B]|nr:hypothetical protein [Mucilaginibacter sp. SG538B]
MFTASAVPFPNRALLGAKIAENTVQHWMLHKTKMMGMKRIYTELPFFHYQRKQGEEINNSCANKSPYMTVSDRIDSDIDRLRFIEQTKRRSCTGAVRRLVYRLRSDNRLPVRGRYWYTLRIRGANTARIQLESPVEFL